MFVQRALAVGEDVMFKWRLRSRTAARPAISDQPGKVTAGNASE